jgi:hypothetical protein
LRNGNELECSGFTITPSPLKHKFLRSPTGTPSRSESTTGGRIPQGPRHNIHSKTKRTPGKHSKTYSSKKKITVKHHQRKKKKKKKKNGKKKIHKSTSIPTLFDFSLSLSPSPILFDPELW